MKIYLPVNILVDEGDVDSRGGDGDVKVKKLSWQDK